MGLLTRTRKPTKEEKRHAVFSGRFNAATSPAEKLRVATDYIRTACRDLEPDAAERVAVDLFRYGAQTDGLNVQ